MAVSDQVLGGVLVAVGVVAIFGVFGPTLRAQREASALKGRLAHLPRGERRGLGRVVLRGGRRRCGQGVTDHRRGEASVVAQWFWAQRWSAVSSAGAVVMLGGLALQSDGAGWLLVLFAAGGLANTAVAVLGAVRAVAGRRYLRGESTAVPTVLL